jgi:G6PDH family F420-dependent oxidoreductase
MAHRDALETPAAVMAVVISAWDAVFAGTLVTVAAPVVVAVVAAVVDGEPPAAVVAEPATVVEVAWAAGVTVPLSLPPPQAAKDSAAVTPRTESRVMCRMVGVWGRLLGEGWEIAGELLPVRPGEATVERAEREAPMVQVGYTMMCEQAGPRQLVDDVVAAEAAGFDFAVISDHYFPWLEVQGHSPYAWSVLGAAAWATSTIPLMTYVTCPTFRYHPAVVAQKAATLQLLSEGRFTLGLGAGENLNEHVVGGGWPPVDVRHAMLREAVEIIRRLWAGGYVNYDGDHFEVCSAKIWDLPPEPPDIGIAVSGPQSTALAGELADAMIAIEPDPELGASFDAAGGAGKPRIGQLAVSFDTDRAAALARAREQFRWFGGGWKVNSELPGPSAFDAASQFVREDDIEQQIPCGDDVDRVVEAVKAFADAGFTHVALVQIGGDRQQPFIDWAGKGLLDAVRSL